MGQTLAADTDGVADADGLDNATYSYQWLADDVDISGATSARYKLTDSEEGKAIKVTVSFTDDAGNEESLTSVATAVVAAASVCSVICGVLGHPFVSRWANGLHLRAALERRARFVLQLCDTARPRLHRDRRRG